MMVSHDNDDRDVHHGDDDLLVLVVHGSARQAWRENNIKMQNQIMPSKHREQMMFHIFVKGSYPLKKTVKKGDIVH